MQKIQIDDFSYVKMLSQLSLSPEGTKAAFVVSQAQVKGNKYVSNIWLLEDGKTRKLSNGGGARGLAWLGEGTIVFPGG